jgi:hypothetical protein
MPTAFRARIAVAATSYWLAEQVRRCLRRYTTPVDAARGRRLAAPGPDAHERVDGGGLLACQRPRRVARQRHHEPQVHRPPGGEPEPLQLRPTGERPPRQDEAALRRARVRGAVSPPPPWAATKLDLQTLLAVYVQQRASADAYAEVDGGEAAAPAGTKLDQSLDAIAGCEQHSGRDARRLRGEPERCMAARRPCGSGRGRRSDGEYRGRESQRRKDGEQAPDAHGQSR